jgi:membrane protein implicated in regulation of membrane protease activity
MSNTEKPDQPGDLSPEELRRLETWKAPDPPPGFSARVVARTRAQKAPAASRTTPPLTRAERERRRRRRAIAGALLGGVAVSGGGGFVAWQAAVAQGPVASHAMTVYLSALAFGGVLLIASLLGGHGHADHDAGHADGHDGDHGADADSAANAALVLPFLSLRFWIFGLTFFGLTGAILHGFGLAGPLATAVIASVMGLGMGYGAAQLFQTLSRQTVGQIAADGGHVGREGKLLLPTSRGQRGKMRVVVNGVATDLLTETDDEKPLPAGTTVMIVGMRGTVAVIERSPTANHPTEQGEEP